MNTRVILNVIFILFLELVEMQPFHLNFCQSAGSSREQYRKSFVMVSFSHVIVLISIISAILCDAFHGAAAENQT